MQNYKIELFGFPSSGKCIKLVLTIYMSVMARCRAPDLFTYEIQTKVMKIYFKKHYKECYLLQHSVIVGNCL